MKKVHIKYVIFKYEELCPESQKRALDKFNETNYYDEILYETLEACFLDKISDKSITQNEYTLLYSLSHSQGDGVCFTGSFLWNNIDVLISHDSRYMHSKSVNFNFNDNVSSSLINEFKNLYESICKDLEHVGYIVIDYEESEENFKELCEINDYWFHANGNLFEISPGDLIELILTKDIQKNEKN